MIEKKAIYTLQVPVWNLILSVIISGTIAYTSSCLLINFIQIIVIQLLFRWMSGMYFTTMLSLKCGGLFSWNNDSNVLSFFLDIERNLKISIHGFDTHSRCSFIFRGSFSMYWKSQVIHGWNNCITIVVPDKTKSICNGDRYSCS